MPDKTEKNNEDILEDYSYLEAERELAKINYSGNVEGEEIFLKDILSEFGKFKLKEPFVYIVGGLCNHGKTHGDIDILIKKTKPANEDEDIPLKFRIMRQLPQKYWARLHFLYDDELHGPFSISGDRTVPIKSNNDLKFLRIEDLFESYSKDKKTGNFETIDVKNLETIGYEDGLSKWVKIKKVIRHKYKGSSYRLKQKYGETEVTGAHSIFDRDLNLFKPEENKWMFSLRSIPKLPELYLPFSLDVAFTKKSKFNGWKNREISFKDKIETEKELISLLKLLAGYCTEGHSSSGKFRNSYFSRIVINNSDLSYLNELSNCYKNLSNGIPYLQDRSSAFDKTSRLVFSNLAAYDVFTQLCSSLSDNKEIPSFIFRLKNKYKKIFFDELLRGDGCIRNRVGRKSPRISYISSSPKMTGGVCYLLSSLNQNFSIECNEHNKKRTWAVVLKDKEQNQGKKQIFKRKANDEWFYDLECEGVRNFVDAIGFVLLHNTNYVPLYSLVCDINTKEVYEMSEDFSNINRLSSAEQAAKSRSQDKIVPFRFFTQPKPVHGRAKEEIYSFESIEETLNKLKQWREQINKGIYLEKKFDGVRCQAHKVGKKVLIMTEEGTDVTKKIPTIADELLKRPVDFIVEFEAELWLKGKHQNRADSAGVLHKKDSEDEKFMVANLYDCLWFEGKDIHSASYPERRKDLTKVRSSAHVKVSESTLAKGISAIKRLSKRISSLPGSEGVIYKLPSFVYELDGKSLNFMKFKKEQIIIAKVIAVNKVKGTEKTFYYHCAIEGNTFVGKTFNTSLKLNVGEKLEVVFVDLNQYTDPKTKKIFFNWWAPRVIEKSQKGVTTIAQAKKLVQETSGQIGEKKLPKIKKAELEEYLAIDSETGEEKSVNVSQLSFKKRFVFQNHYRGKSCHGDLRFETNGNLEGYTLMHQIEGEIKEPVILLDHAKREDADSKNWKINLKTGELRQEKIEIATKARQPKVWLDIAPGISLSGMEAGVGKRPEPGATAKFPGVFTKIDSGTYEEGARKPFYFEYFMNGKVFKGRYIVRQLGAERIKGEEARKPFVWFFWKAKDQTPYVLSSRGISKEYVPDKGKSALPLSWEGKVPVNLKWWKKGLTGEKALEMIKEIRKVFLKTEQLAGESVSDLRTKKITADEESEIIKENKKKPEAFKKHKFKSAVWTHPNGHPRCLICGGEPRTPRQGETPDKDGYGMCDARKKGELEELDQTKFALKRKWWKGQFVIRGLPVEHFEIRFSDSKNTFFKLGKNPVAAETGITSLRSTGRKSELMFEGKIAPGAEGNPNKKIPAFVDILDSGSCNIIEDSEHFMHVEFKGSKLKGNWVFKRTDPQSNIWLMSKGKLSEVTKSNSHEFGVSLSDYEINKIHFLSENYVGVSEIARLMERPNSTIYDWQNKMNI